MVRRSVWRTSLRWTAFALAGIRDPCSGETIPHVLTDKNTSGMRPVLNASRHDGRIDIIPFPEAIGTGGVVNEATKNLPWRRLNLRVMS